MLGKDNINVFSKFQHDYLLQEVSPGRHLDLPILYMAPALEQLLRYNLRKPEERIAGVFTSTESLLPVLDRIDGTSENGYVTTIPRNADACYDINFIFKEGQECDLFIHTTSNDKINITNMYTKDSPIYLVCFDFNCFVIWTKYKPIDIFVKWIFLENEKRHDLYCSDFLTVNAYFTTLYRQGWVFFYKNEHFKQFHFVAKRIQTWWKKWLQLLKIRRYFLVCRGSIRDELIYLPPSDGGFFEGGIMYQNAMENFNCLKSQH